MSTEEIKDTRRRWTREETLLLLQCYNARKNEFKHSRKKKFAYANVLQDMLAQNFKDTTVTTRTLEAKMRTLLEAYKSDKAKNRKNGRSAPFMNELDEIFEHEPIIYNSHTLNIGTSRQMPLAESCKSAAIEHPSLYNNPLSSSLDSGFKTEILPSCYHDSSAPLPSIVSTNNHRKGKSAQEKYYEKKLKLKKQFYEDIKKMISDKLNAL